MPMFHLSCGGQEKRWVATVSAFARRGFWARENPLGNGGVGRWDESDSWIFQYKPVLIHH